MWVSLESCRFVVYESSRTISIKLHDVAGTFVLQWPEGSEFESLVLNNYRSMMRAGKEEHPLCQALSEIVEWVIGDL